MKTHKLRIMAEPLKRILSGHKLVEGRLASKCMREIQVGDLISFECEGLKCDPIEVVGVRQYPNFREMIADVGVSALGFPEMTPDQLGALYKRIYWYPDAEKNGVLAIRLRT